MRDVEKRKLGYGTASTIGIATNVSGDSTTTNTTTTKTTNTDNINSNHDSKE